MKQLPSKAVAKGAPRSTAGQAPVRERRRTPSLPHAHATFVKHYVANGGNGTRAYLAAYPRARSINGAAENAYKLRKLRSVQAAIAAAQAELWKQQQMDAEEATALIANDARADIRELYDDDGELLPIRQWPDSIALSVKLIRPGKDGPTVVLNDSQAARRLIAEMTGKLKNPLAGVGDLARILAGDFEEDE